MKLIITQTIHLQKFLTWPNCTTLAAILLALGLSIYLRNFMAAGGWLATLILFALCVFLEYILREMNQLIATILSGADDAEVTEITKESFE